MFGKAKTFQTPEQQLEIIAQGSVDLIQKQELLEKLKENRPLVIKAGFDPSRPDIHFGHSVLINKLRQFQELGHTVLFIVGDFTACIGDPSGQNKTRPSITKKEAEKNAKTYIKQVTQKLHVQFDEDKVTKYLEDKKLTNFKKPIKQVFCFFQKLNPKSTKFQYNSQWLSKLSLNDFLIKVTSQLTVARQLERNDFSERYQAQKPIGLHEFLYPVLQAYDSYHIKADLEIGGTDQLFNLLLGRELQQNSKQKAQCVLTLPLLEGLDGVQKMSKSLDNYISYNESPKQIYGKVMKASDELLVRYFDIFTLGQGIDKNSLSGSDYKNLKQALAWIIVSCLYGYDEAKEAEKEFVSVFSGGGLPQDIVQKTLPQGQIWVCALIKDIGLAPSTSEAKRQILSGAVKKDGQKLQDATQKLNLNSGDEFLLSIGRRKFVKVKVK